MGSGMRIALVAVAIATVALLGGHVAAASAQVLPPELLFKTPEDGIGGSGAGEMNFPGAVAASPVGEGHVYVADTSNERIDEFSAWGEFLQAWGWGVADGTPTSQKCTQASGCRAGVTGGGAGQFDDVGGAGIATDTSGDVYVGESGNHRVQKFDASGSFLLMFGRNVNATKVAEPGSSQAERDICTVTSGDTCQAGTAGTEPGEFEQGQGRLLSVDPLTGSVYVGERGRIQKFSAGGVFVEDIALGLPTNVSLTSLAVDENGILYVTMEEEESPGAVPRKRMEIRKLTSNGPSADYLGSISLSRRPSNVAVVPGGELYVQVLETTRSEDLDDEGPAALLVLSPDGTCLNCGTEGEDGKSGFGQLPQGTQFLGIASGSACGPADIYVTHTTPGLGHPVADLTAYGDPPNPGSCPPPLRPPEIVEQFVRTAGTSSATVAARINPRFQSDTTYYVEYGTEPCTSGQCQVMPVAPGQTLTSSVTQRPVDATVQLSQLQSETTYYFRFAAESAGGGPVRGSGGRVGRDGAEGSFTTFPVVQAPYQCPNDQFRVGLGAWLPNCRAYEMVSPVEKGGGDVAPGAGATFRSGLGSNATLAEAAADGERATFSSLRAFANPQAAPYFNQYLSVRTDSGWQTTSISPPRKSFPYYGPGASVQYKSFSENLCAAWVTQESNVQLAEGAPAGFMGAYVRADCSEPVVYKSLTDVAPPGYVAGKGEGEPGGGYLILPQGHSANAAATVFRASASLTKNACDKAGINQLYESAEPAPVRLVSVEPNGAAACSHSFLGTKASTESAFGDGFREANTLHAVSEDGEIVYWTDSGRSDNNDAPGPGTLYIRVNSTQPQSIVSGSTCTQPTRACTYRVSAGEDAVFWAASPEGGSAIYTNGDELLSYDLASRTSHLIANEVTGVVGASADLSRVYFVSTGVLTGTQQNSAGEEARVGAPNLYLAEAGTFTFVASLGTLEGSSSVSGLPSSPANSSPWLRTARVTADGRHLAFTSARALTGYDNADAASGEPDTELFLYDASLGGGAGKLTCISCNPTGARPIGRQITETSDHAVLWGSAQLPGWAEQGRPTRFLAEDGNRLLFESFDGLVPRDDNGMRDVYEWERSGSKSGCSEQGDEIYAPASGGCISLISSGSSDQNSELIDASVGGRDIFFATQASLVPQDPGYFDIYDARREGGFNAVGKPTPCGGEEDCQPTVSVPELVSPGSGTTGPANPRKAGCPKGKHQVSKAGNAKCEAKGHKGKAKRRKGHKRNKHNKKANQRGRGHQGRRNTR